MNGHELRRTLDVHQVISRIYNDKRFPPACGSHDVRQFAITTIWVVSVERLPGKDWYPRMCELLPHGSDGFWASVKEDAPRYEPENPWPFGGPCPAPMIRRDGPCGKRGRDRIRITSPVDGTWRWEFYCLRHREVFEQVKAEQDALRKAGVFPEPMPNKGGVLPTYIRWDWPEEYSRARPGWKPPAVGIRADDWPTLAKVEAVKAPTLTVVAGGGEAVAVGEVPKLRLVRPGDKGPSLRLVDDKE